MRRLTVRVIAAVLTFIVGVTAASLWFNPRPSTAVKLEAVAPSQALAISKRSYSRGGVAGESESGYFSAWVSSDGMQFTRWVTECGSPRRAKREMERRLKMRGVEIVSREPMFDESGQQIGERVLALLPPDDLGHTRASLLWVEKNDFVEVTGTSLHDIMEYKKDFNY
jgi:hypothetical protein